MRRFRVSVKAKAVGLLILYLVLAKSFYFVVIATFSLAASYFFIGLWSVTFGTIFLYLFSHEEFFRFAKFIELREKKQEDWWLHALAHVGKGLTAVVIGTLLGPILAALSVRILFPGAAYRYYLVAMICVVSDLFWVSVGKGVIEIAL